MTTEQALRECWTAPQVNWLLGQVMARLNGLASPIEARRLIVARLIEMACDDAELERKPR